MTLQKKTNKKKQQQQKTNRKKHEALKQDKWNFLLYFPLQLLNNYLLNKFPIYCLLYIINNNNEDLYNTFIKICFSALHNTQTKIKIINDHPPMFVYNRHAHFYNIYSSHTQVIYRQVIHAHFYNTNLYSK